VAAVRSSNRHPVKAEARSRPRDRSIGGSYCEALDALTQTTAAHVCALERRSGRTPSSPDGAGNVGAPASLGKFRRSGYGAALKPPMEWQQC